MIHIDFHDYFFPFFFVGRCESALPAADLDALLVFLFLSTDDAALAAFLAALGLVTFDFAIALYFLFFGHGVILREWKSRLVL